MTYYKIILNNTIIGVATTDNLRKYQTKHNALLYSNENDMEYIECNENLYRDEWFKQITNNDIHYISATINNIDENEYNSLLNALQTEETITEDETVDDISIEPEQEQENPDITLTYVKAMKIADMSRICNLIITSGVDVLLSDNHLHHFSLTVQDQLNLISLLSMVQNGELQIPYHADGELCRYYNPNEIMWIVDAATQYKAYHTTYYNSLKNYINDLDDIQIISAINYGDDIPAQYKSEILIEYENAMSGNNIESDEEPIIEESIENNAE